MLVMRCYTGKRVLEGIPRNLLSGVAPGDLHSFTDSPLNSSVKLIRVLARLFAGQHHVIGCFRELEKAQKRVAKAVAVL